MTPVEFLLARVAEDEAAASYTMTRGDVESEDWGGWWLGHYQHYSRQTPGRVMRRCSAIRRVVELHQSWPVLVETQPTLETVKPFDPLDPFDGVTMRMSQQLAWLTQQEYRKAFGSEPPTSPMIRALAAAWADHPDYDQAWA